MTKILRSYIQKERETLTKAVKTSIKYREQVVEMVLKLDVSTVK